MNRFEILRDNCTTGFHEHVVLNPLKPIPEQLEKRLLQFRSGGDQGKPAILRNIIERNSSLRVDFNWSFESSHMFQQMMNECVEEVTPQYNTAAGNMVSDMRCSWLGFIPFNVFEKVVYEDMSTTSLILFNNELVSFQIDVIRFITKHKTFLQHSILRNERYRFELFKDIRKNREKLADAYNYYMEAVKETSLILNLPRDILEEQIGCHFLYNSDLFFELLEFSILKGEVYE